MKRAAVDSFIVKTGRKGLWLLLWLLPGLGLQVQAQQKNFFELLDYCTLDSMRAEYHSPRTTPEQKVWILERLILSNLEYVKPDSLVVYSDEFLELNKRLQVADSEPIYFYRQSMWHFVRKEYDAALAEMKKCIEWYDARNYVHDLSSPLGAIRSMFNYAGRGPERLHLQPGKAALLRAAGAIQKHGHLLPQHSRLITS